MKTTNVIIVAAVALIGILLAFSLLSRKFESDGGDSDVSQTRTEAEHSTGGFGTLIKKHRQYSLPFKGAIAVLGVFAFAALGYLYISLQQGHPVPIPYKMELAVGAGFVLFLFTGIGIANRKNARRGRIEITYEDDTGAEAGTETVYYDPATVETNGTDGNGNKVVKEQWPTRILGLFSRTKLVAHDRELRPHRVHLAEPVKHEIPSHATRRGPNHYEFRTQEQNKQKKPDKAADYTYDPSHQMRHEEAQNLRAKVNRLETQVRTEKVEKAALERGLDNIERRLKSEDLKDRDEAVDEVIGTIEKLQGVLGDTTVAVEKTNGDRRPESQREVDTSSGASSGD